MLQHALVLYVVRRLVFAVALVVVASSGAVVLTLLAPGDVTTGMVRPGVSPETIARERANFNLHVVETTRAGRLTADRIVEATGGIKRGTRAYFCGPERMRDTVKVGLARKGLARRHFHYEEFEIRSSIWPLTLVLKPLRRILATTRTTMTDDEAGPTAVRMPRS